MLFIVGAACLQAEDPSRWLVLPGKSVGPVTARTTRADIKRIFGVGRVKDDMVSSGGDAEPELATVVNGADSESALTVFWSKLDPTGKHPAASAHPVAVNLCYGSGPPSKTCKWHLADNISFGTSLRELERLNGRSFKLYGFGWDYSGAVFDWNGGVLGPELTGCGRVLLRLDAIYPQAGPSPEQQKWLGQTSGDGEFASSSAGMQQLNPVVYAVSVEFPTPQNCPASKASGKLP